MKFVVASSFLVASASASLWWGPTVGEVPPVPTVAAPLEEKIVHQRTLQEPQMVFTAMADEEEEYKPECLECGEHETYLYIYKEFDHGVTFAEALLAPTKTHGMQSCILTPVYTIEDVMEISYVIPPGKSAYTAATKSALQMLDDFEACKAGGPVACPEDHDSGSGRKLQGGTCPAYRKGWTNFGTDDEVPTGAWADSEPAFCGMSAIPDTGAVLATDYETSPPSAGLYGVNGGTYLPGAVYRCCKELVTCFLDGKPTGAC